MSVPLHFSSIDEHTVCDTQYVTFMTASVCSSSHPTKACPDSWKATTLCSSLERILLFFTLPEDTRTRTCQSLPDTRHAWTLNVPLCIKCAAQYSVCIILPAITLSTAYSKLKVPMDLCPSLAACRAASLQMLAMSAPAETKPVGNRDMGNGISQHQTCLCCDVQRCFIGLLTRSLCIFKEVLIGPQMFIHYIKTRVNMYKHHWSLGWAQPDAESRN